MPVMGRPNVYGASGMNQYGMPNMNPQITINGQTNQFVKPMIPAVYPNLTINSIKPPSSDNNAYCNLFFNLIS